MPRPEEITHLRSQIRDINEEIIALIAHRTEIAERIGNIKAQNDMPVYQPKQEQNVLSTCRKHAQRHGVDSDSVEEIFEKIIALARRCQRD